MIIRHLRFVCIKRDANAPQAQADRPAVSYSESLRRVFSVYSQERIVRIRASWRRVTLASARIFVTIHA
jgi:hypothetical protein